MTIFYIEKECLKCQSCKFTGWKLIKKTEDKQEAKALLKYNRHYFGNEIKIRLRKEKNQEEKL